MTDEYDKKNIEQLHILIQDDQPDQLDKFAQAWANAAEVLKTEMETLQEHIDGMRAAWTSGASRLYLQKIHDTMSTVTTAHQMSQDRSETVSKVASDVRAANEGVRQTYEEWQAEKVKGPKPEGFFEEALDNFGLWSSEEDDAQYAERRKPFDETARKYLNNAAVKHQENLQKVQSTVPYEPIKFEDDNPFIKDMDFSQPGATAYGADTTAAATTSAAAPSLQSGVSVPSSSVAPGPSPAPSAPSPGPGVAGPGVPVGPGGVPVSRGVTPPVPGRSGSGSGQGPGRGVSRAPRTPSLPGRNGQASGSRPSGMNNSRPGTNTRPGTSGRPGSSSRPSTTGRNATTGRNMSTTRSGTTGRNGAGRNAGMGRNGTAARNGAGRSVSRLAPADRTGRVRASGEVLGQRKPATKPTTTSGTGRGPVRRKVQPAVIGRAGKKNRDRNAKTGARRQRRDNTGHGYTAQVIGQRQAPTEPDYTHTPIVANTIHDAGKVFGARPQADSLESARQHRMRNRRRNTTSPAGVTRPVIGNGITNPHQIHHTPPAQTTPTHHQADRALWQQTTTPTPPVIGTRTPPPVHHHTPGNELKPQPTHHNQQGHGQDHDDGDGHRHDPGPTAFTTTPTPPTWPTQ